jgi:iron complex outermembrane recepter protein
MRSRFRASLYGTTTLAALLVLSGAAFAQTAPATTAPVKAEEDTNVVIVTGIRGSIERAKNIKRNADAVVNAVTLEDLGKFTDSNIGDALQRVPGVQIDRNDAGNSGDRAAVRGLGPIFTAYTLNGRTVFGSGTEGGNELRAFNLDLVSPETISGLVVKKVPTASDTATGLAGQIDIQTLKPLSTSFARGKKLFGSFNVRGEYDEFAGEAGPRISGIIGARLADNTVGLYLSGIFADVPKQRSQYLNGPLFDRNIQLDTNGNKIADAGDRILKVDAPNGRSANLIDENQKRLGFAAGIQIRPDDSLDINIDGFWSRYNNDGTRNRAGPSIQDFSVQAAGGLPGVLLDPNLVTIDKVAFGGTTRDFLSSAQPGAFISTINGANTSANSFAGGTGANSRTQIVAADQIFINKTTMAMLGGNVKYKWDNNEVVGDAYWQSTDYFQRFQSWNVRASTPANAVGFDERPDFPKVIGFQGVIGNSAAYGAPTGFTREILMKIVTKGASVDYSRYDLGDLVSALKFGARFTETDLNRRVSNGTAAADTAIVAASPNYLSSYVVGGTTDRFFPGYDLGQDAYIRLDGKRLRNAFPAIVGAGIDQLGVNASASFKTVEETLALYGRLDFKYAEAVTGNIGLRAVRTGVTTSSSIVVTGSAPTPISLNKTDWQYLPSLNVNWRVIDNVQLRFGLSRVASRPELIDLAPVTVVNAALGTTPSGTIGVTRGNFDLKPYTANQADFTVEWYMPNRGTLVGSVFYKDVSNFIATRTVTNATIAGVSNTVNGINYIYNLTTPINLTSGKVFGSEIGFDQPLWGPLDGFGIQANYTYIDTSVEKSLGVDAAGFPGASKDNVNGSVYYDKYGFNAQLTATYRGSYLRNLSGTGTQTNLSRFTEAQTFVNLNASYAVTKMVEINAAILNLTGEVRRDYAGATQYYLDGFNNGTTYTIGASYRF